MTSPFEGKTWQDWYGFNTNPYSGYSVSQAGGPNKGMAINAVSGSDTGFGGGDLRRARRDGYTAGSILKYLMGDDMVGRDGQFFTQGGTAIGQEAINDLRGQYQQEQAMQTGWDKMGKLLEGYTKTSDLPAAPDLSGYVKKDSLGDYAKKSDVTKNTQNIATAMANAQKVTQNNPYAVTGNSVMGIQQASSPSQVAGALTAGLAGFSRNDKKFQNKTINV